MDTGMIPCKGGTCDDPARCGKACRCTYKSSAEEAREVMRSKPCPELGCIRTAGHEGMCLHSCGKCQSPGCAQCFPPGKPIRIQANERVVELPETFVIPSTLPTDSKARKDIPLARGVLDYFPAALAAVAELSRAGNDKHNPGQPLHWARGKSTDHADCILRHLVDRGKADPEDGISHTVKVAWRALALLQEELEAAGAPKARAAR